MFLHTLLVALWAYVVQRPTQLLFWVITMIAFDGPSSFIGIVIENLYTDDAICYVWHINDILKNIFVAKNIFKMVI